MLENRAKKGGFGAKRRALGKWHTVLSCLDHTSLPVPHELFPVASGEMARISAWMVLPKEFLLCVLRSNMPVTVSEHSAFCFHNIYHTVAILHLLV